MVVVDMVIRSLHTECLHTDMRVIDDRRVRESLACSNKLSVLRTKMVIGNPDFEHLLDHLYHLLSCKSTNPSLLAIQEIYLNVISQPTDLVSKRPHHPPTFSIYYDERQLTLSFRPRGQVRSYRWNTLRNPQFPQTT